MDVRMAIRGRRRRVTSHGDHVPRQKRLEWRASAVVVAAMALSCANGSGELDQGMRGGQMITAVRAFEIAHEAIAGKRCHETACDVVIDREDSVYTVMMSPPADGGRGAEPTRVQVDAATGRVRDIRNPATSEPDPRHARSISSKRALDIGVATVRELGIEYDDRWTTTARIQGDKYEVTFPVPEATRAVPRRPDFAYQVWVDLRTGKVVGGRSAS